MGLDSPPPVAVSTMTTTSVTTTDREIGAEMSTVTSMDTGEGRHTNLGMCV